jgi:hypothetical protein
MTKASQEAEAAVRFRAVRCAIFYGLTPYWLYEDEPHYAPWSYWRHLRENLAYGVRWLLFVETDEDRAFEREVNGKSVDCALRGSC